MNNSEILEILEILESIENTVYKLGDDKVCVYEISEDTNIELNELLELIHSSKKIKVHVTREVINLRRIGKYTLDELFIHEAPIAGASIHLNFNGGEGKPSYGFRGDLMSKSPIHVLKALELMVENLRNTIDYGRIS